MLSRMGDASVSATCNDATEATSSTDQSYGIATDPLTQFACIFAALIHDVCMQSTTSRNRWRHLKISCLSFYVEPSLQVDHAGVPNSQLVKEHAPTAIRYRDKSVAEQNSIDVAWTLLLQPSFTNFRHTLCSTVTDMQRFRQLIVNIVMATDLMDPDLKRLRNTRWNRAFVSSSDSSGDNVHRKATIVLETLIQASDVSHTMQHWYIYRKWNQRLFNEMMTAYRQGRAETNPVDSWYQGELNFFDFYIIPLAKKLEECRAFSVSSDEYLCYALKNRAEWELCGLDIVSEMRAHEETEVAHRP
jgi:3'5'-cyclic nucleotide phosphodiesterase